MNIRNSIQALKDEITAYRRSMHEHPQTAYEEEFASDLVAEKLSEWGIEHERGIAVTGIVATIKGKQAGGKTIALRADMDALDILEANNKPWVSKISGKMHGCGHDGHTAMLLGAAKYLNENRNFAGTVRLIFQPAEEFQGGAYRMIEEGVLERFNIDEVYGLHNWPHLPKGTVATRVGPLMAGAERFDIFIEGHGGHAAAPHRCKDPIIVGTAIVTALQTLVSRTADPLDSVVISVTNFKAGTGAFNVIPETAEISGTLRTFLPQTRDLMMTRIREMSADIAKTYNVRASCEFMDGGYIPTVNSAEQTMMCAAVARAAFGDENVDANANPKHGRGGFRRDAAAAPRMLYLDGARRGRRQIHT